MELKLKRVIIFTGAIMTLGGSLGLIVYRTATVGTFNILLLLSAADAPPAALVELQFFLMAETAFVVGVVTSCIAMLVRDNNARTSSSSRWFCAASGALLVVGSIFLIWSLLDVKAEFRVLCSAVTVPTVESLQNMIHSSESRITTGYSLWLISSIFVLLALWASSQSKSAPKACWSPAPKTALSMIGVFVGALLLILLFFISKDGTALELMISGKTFGKPEYLARHLSSILNRSILVFGGVAMLGAVQLWASLWRTTSDSTSASSS